MRPQQLGHRRFGARRAGRNAGQGAQRVRPHHLEARPGPGQLVAHDRVVGRTGALGQRDDAVELASEPDLLAERGHTALEAERAHGDPPAVTD
jgi:hypothetical protein